MKSQNGSDLEYRPGSTHLPALLRSPLFMSSVMVKNNMSDRFSHLEMFFFPPVKVVLIMLKTKMGDLVIVTLFVILFLSSDFLYIQNNLVFMGRAKKEKCKTLYVGEKVFGRLLSSAIPNVIRHDMTRSPAFPPPHHGREHYLI